MFSSASDGIHRHAYASLRVPATVLRFECAATRRLRRCAGATVPLGRTLAATARRGHIHTSLPTSFFVVILDGQRGDEEAGLIRASLDPQVLATIPELTEHLRQIEEA